MGSMGVGKGAVSFFFAFCCIQLLACCSQSAAGQKLIFDPGDLYAMDQLWGAWNSSNSEVRNELAGWNSNSSYNPPCTRASPWRGVFCHAKPVSEDNTSSLDVWITGLTLIDASLEGVLPSAIANLSNLVSLTLNGNPLLTGPLPKELGLLVSLFDLDLHGNGFNGSIPKFEPGVFAFLQGLDLSGNQLSGELPTNNVISFQTIQTLNLSHNSFYGGIQSNFLPYLQHLISADLSFNTFNGPLPIMSGYMPNATQPLSYLDFSSNSFNGTFPNASGYQSLDFLNVSYNQLSGELNEANLFNMTSLTALDLSHNSFNGSIPNLSSLAALKTLDLSYNNFQPGSFPAWAMNLSNLASLSLNGDALSGDISQTMAGGFQKLQILSLDDNNFTGTLDIAKMFNLPNRQGSLQLISLRNNQITNLANSNFIINTGVPLFNLSGNPYCDNSTTETDLKRCVCNQRCFDTSRYVDNKKVIIIATVVAGSFVALCVLLASFIVYKSRRDKYQALRDVQQRFDEYEVKPTLYTYNELRVATQDFHPLMKLGEGNYGVVYKGTLSNGSKVAVKQLFTKFQQNMDDFLNEVILVAAVKHRNLVKLKGCCFRKDQRLLVYEYVENCDLAQILFEKKMKNLLTMTWPIRLNICIGVANGLHYLHSLTQPKIIHRDIKASNVLLDQNLQPKIADFGLALLFPDEQSHIVTTHIAGTRGYLAPEYATLGHLSEKVDVYSFGVLLVEIVSGRRNIDTKLPLEKMYLPEWAWALHDEGNLMDLVDPTLALQIDEEMEVRRVLCIALLCLHTTVEKRPTMARVVNMLQGDMDSEVLVGRNNSDGSLNQKFDDLIGSHGSMRFFDPSSTTEEYGQAPLSSTRPSSLSRDSLLTDLTKTYELSEINLVR